MNGTSLNKIASSAESVGPVRLWKPTHGVVQRCFSGGECPEAVGFSGGEFQFVVQALHDAGGDRPSSPKPVEDQLAVPPQ